MEVLRVENLCKVYGKGETRVEALKNVSFSMEKGEFAAVLPRAKAVRPYRLDFGGCNDYTRNDN